MKLIIKNQLTHTLIILSLILFSTKQSCAQLGPVEQNIGCPTNALDWWATCEDPDYEMPMLVPNYRYCFNCEYGVCDALDWQCDVCIEITKIEYVFNPKNGNYETIYVVRFEENGTQKVYYTYQVIKIPIYRVNADGTIGEIIGYKYKWQVIPNLIAIGYDPINMRRYMIYNE